MSNKRSARRKTDRKSRSADSTAPIFVLNEVRGLRGQDVYDSLHQPNTRTVDYGPASAFGVQPNGDYGHIKFTKTGERVLQSEAEETIGTGPSDGAAPLPPAPPSPPLVKVTQELRSKSSPGLSNSLKITREEKLPKLPTKRHPMVETLSSPTSSSTASPSEIPVPMVRKSSMTSRSISSPQSTVKAGLPPSLPPFATKSRNKPSTTLHQQPSTRAFAENEHQTREELQRKHDAFLRQLSTEKEESPNPGYQDTELLTNDASNKGEPNLSEGNLFEGLSAPPEILARGPRARQAYAEAARDGSKKVFRTRLMLVGQERVGKTSLKKALTGQRFNRQESITDGVETTNACDINIEVATSGGQTWSIHKKRNEKEDEYSQALADEIAKRLIISTPKDDSKKDHVDTTDGCGYNPEDAGKAMASTLESGAPDDDPMPNQIASLVENMIKEQVRLRQRAGAATNDSQKSAVSLSIWDFAGHDTYYTTHQVFLTWRAVYIVVFDLSRDLDSIVPPEDRNEFYETAKGNSKSELTCLQFINFWLNSIYAHAVAPPPVINNTRKTQQKSPPIFIVGTHRDNVMGDKKEKHKKIAATFQKIRKNLQRKPYECHVIPKFYAIENSKGESDEELVALRTHIEMVASAEPYMGEEIPIRWLLFEEALAADRINYMSLDQTKELTRPVGVETERELVTMLNFYHDLGHIVYFGDMDDYQSLLRDIVILNPQWLIDVFKQVITVLEPDKRDGIVSDAWTRLEVDGILEERLIHHMWQRFLEQKDALVELMARFDLICEAPAQNHGASYGDEDLEGYVEEEADVLKCYYVPSRLTPRCSPEEIGQIDAKSSMEFYVDFHGFLPDGLFHRLMTRAVRWIGERDGQPVFLFYRQISLMPDEEHQALMEMMPPHESTIKVTVFRAAVADLEDDRSNDVQSPDPHIVNQVVTFVIGTLDNLRVQMVKRIKYDVCFACPKCGKKKPLRDCFQKKSLRCGMHVIPTSSVRAKFGIDTSGVEAGSDTPVVCRKPKNIICDIYFIELAEKIGSEWQMLGIRLGLKQADIDRIVEDKVRSIDRIFAVLQLWEKRARSDKKELIEELCNALSGCSRTDLADEIKSDAGISELR